MQARRVRRRSPVASHPVGGAGVVAGASGDGRTGGRSKPAAVSRWWLQLSVSTTQARASRPGDRRVAARPDPSHRRGSRPAGPRPRRSTSGEQARSASRRCQAKRRSRSTPSRCRRRVQCHRQQRSSVFASASEPQGQPRLEAHARPRAVRLSRVTSTRASSASGAGERRSPPASPRSTGHRSAPSRTSDEPRSTRSPVTTRPAPAPSDRRTSRQARMTQREHPLMQGRCLPFAATANGAQADASSTSCHRLPRRRCCRIRQTSDDRLRSPGAPQPSPSPTASNPDR